MNPVKIFNIVVVLDVLAYLLFILLPYFDTAFMSEQESNAFSYLGYNAPFFIPAFLIWSMTLLWFISIIGLVLFKDWARKLFVVVLVVMLLSTTIGGMEIQFAHEHFLEFFGDMADGFILALVYFSDLKYRFVKKEKSVKKERSEGVSMISTL